jgi:uncharacterized protein YndB with AHSA1/START domain
VEEERETITLVRRIYIGAPAEEVWPWLVEPERVERYHLAMLKKRPAAVGDRIEYLGKIGYQTVVEGVVEELVETRKLVHTYNFHLDEEEADSRVSYELVRYGDEMCCLEVTHSGLREGGETHRTVDRSWDITLSSLKTVIETGKPLPWPQRRR